jgi:predicted O-methyltransferase YrrM
MEQPLVLDRAAAITGWMSMRELTWLATTARACSLIVEIGSYQGRSTRALGDNCPGTVYAIDPWVPLAYMPPQIKRHGDTWPHFTKNLRDLLQIVKVVPIKHRSVDAWPHLLRLLGGRKVDCVFIDGDHDEPAVRLDIQLALQVLKHNGILSGHDYSHKDWAGVKEVVDELYPGINHVDSIWWTRCASSFPV